MVAIESLAVGLSARRDRYGSRRAEPGAVPATQRDVTRQRLRAAPVGIARNRSGVGEAEPLKHQRVDRDQER